MRTTIDLPDNLLIAAKQRAASERKPLRALIEAGLREQLAKTGGSPAETGHRRGGWHIHGRRGGSHRKGDKSKQTAQQRRNIRWVVAEGGLPAELDDLSDRAAMHDALGRKP